MNILSAWFYGNLFIAINWAKGIDKTVLFINRLATNKTADKVFLNKVSENIDFWFEKFPILLLGRKQKCLVRGYTLFYYGKRGGYSVRLNFGAKADNKLEILSKEPVKWHCWLTENENLLFEVPDEIRHYQKFFHFS